MKQLFISSLPKPIMINEYVAQFEDILKKNYPSGQVPKKIIKNIKHEVNKDISSKKENNQGHKTVQVKHPKYNYICDIDKGISELINYLWTAGIDTNNSCENNVPDGYMWICFRKQEDLEKFLNILFKGADHDNKIYLRACFSKKYNENAWIYDYYIFQDFAPGEGKVRSVYSSISLRFPKSDYEWMVHQIKTYLISQKIIDYNCYY
ncbi:hypothetical protein QJ856_gp0669 [Tupanvirus deep ocean]|uniref:Uncharacterized protein n=2 Tax=Tupanvirus TaxID=2094720 RepID=A0AC62A8I2_9VIRU|nr:hypothetical protein QJ856_gp0669 [Tupanvirus deep ocean]QKU34081.1 hypothetical protein [Tupanvirus deep ocean]